MAVRDRERGEKRSGDQSCRLTGHRRSHLPGGAADGGSGRQHGCVRAAQAGQRHCQGGGRCGSSQSRPDCICSLPGSPERVPSHCSSGVPGGPRSGQGDRGCRDVCPAELEAVHRESDRGLWRHRGVGGRHALPGCADIDRGGHIQHPHGSRGSVICAWAGGRPPIHPANDHPNRCDARHFGPSSDWRAQLRGTVEFFFTQNNVVCTIRRALFSL